MLQGSVAILESQLRILAHVEVRIDEGLKELAVGPPLPPSIDDEMRPQFVIAQVAEVGKASDMSLGPVELKVQMPKPLAHSRGPQIEVGNSRRGNQIQKTHRPDFPCPLARI